MKKYAIFCAVICATMITFAGANAKVERAFELRPADLGIESLQANIINKSFVKADIQKMDFRGIAPMRDVVLDEADYEPNDWDGAAWPPTPWDGLIGVLTSMETTILNGVLDTTGSSGGWWSGDTDLFGFGLPADGILDLTVEFSEPCEDDNIYNAWFLGEATDGLLYILDLNFPYPYVAPVTCPFEGSYAIEPYGAIDEEETIFFINQFYVYVCAWDGVAPSYTITWYFSDCDDLDGDGYFDETCGGSDCDDEDPFVHPCALEVPGNGFDEDCSGADRVLVGDQVSEIEPNDDETEAQDLGALAFGESVEISGNYCSAYDGDYYMVDLPAMGTTLTLTMTYEGVTEEIVCWAIDGAEYGTDFWFGIMPGDLDGDEYYDVGDYILLAEVGAADDVDQDGWFSDETCGVDCDDTDPTINPCNPEQVVDAGDGIDQDCTGIEDTLNYISEGLVYEPPDLDLKDDGIDEIEPNDDIDAGISHDLGMLDEGITTVYGDLSSVGYETGDYDFYQFELPNAGFVFFQLMFDCYADYDLYVLAYFDPDGPEPAYEAGWWIVGQDAYIYVPETSGGSVTEDGGWEFPLAMAVWVVGWEGDPGYYYLELFWDSACIDWDGDGYGGGVDPSFEPIWEATGDCTSVDCDDTNPLVNPGMIESTAMGNCANGLDDDCDGLADAADADCKPACPATIVPASGSPVAFYLIPALALVFVIRRFRR